MCSGQGRQRAEVPWQPYVIITGYARIEPGYEDGKNQQKEGKNRGQRKPVFQGTVAVSMEERLCRLWQQFPFICSAPAQLCVAGPCCYHNQHNELWSRLHTVNTGQGNTAENYRKPSYSTELLFFHFQRLFCPDWLIFRSIIPHVHVACQARNRLHWMWCCNSVYEETAYCVERVEQYGSCCYV